MLEGTNPSLVSCSPSEQTRAVAESSAPVLPETFVSVACPCIFTWFQEVKESLLRHNASQSQHGAGRQWVGEPAGWNSGRLVVLSWAVCLVKEQSWEGAGGERDSSAAQQGVECLCCVESNSISSSAGVRSGEFP